MPGVYVDFEECKAKISLPDVLAVFGIADRFHERNGTWRGVCPHPSHIHNPVRPNPTGFTFGIHDGIWKWRCWGDCRAVGTVVTFVERFLQIEPAHVRLWFHEHFANRLTARPPDAKRGGESRPRDSNPETKKARPVLQTPERAEQKTSTPEKVPEDAGEYKPIRFTLNLDREVPYLKERGFCDDVLARYGIGLCKRGMLNGYVAIPVWETPPGKNPYGYLGRWPGDDFNANAGRPKYRWPANFPKQRFLFGLNEALDGTDGLPLLVVEGVFDAVRCVQNGYLATVAIFGSCLSEQQAELLNATGRPVLLMFDGDDAGQSGMLDAAQKLATRAFVRVIRLDGGRQPDDLSATELTQCLGIGDSLARPR